MTERGTYIAKYNETKRGTKYPPRLLSLKNKGAVGGQREVHVIVCVPIGGKKRGAQGQGTGVAESSLTDDKFRGSEVGEGHLFAKSGRVPRSMQGQTTVGGRRLNGWLVFPRGRKGGVEKTLTKS